MYPMPSSIPQDMQDALTTFTSVAHKITKQFDWRGTRDRALNRIVVGPAADFNKASKFAKDCMHEFHVEDVEVIQSQVPYRAL
jgi:L-lysine 2,3-aminomutase